MKLSAPDLLSELVSIPSVNPMGRALQGEIYYEERISLFLENLFGRLNIQNERIEVAPHRHNVIAYLPGDVGRPTLLLDAHQDTVLVDSMTIDPFLPVVRESKMFGRGTCDVKGGLAAMIAAVARAAELPVQQRCSVILACTCDEEFGQLGVKDVIQLCRNPDSNRSKILNKLPDAVIVAEPTNLDLVVAHRGTCRWRITAHGKSAHSSEPRDGINAIYRMAEILLVLQEYANDLQKNFQPHPLCGPATLSVGRIDGGESVNVVPASCTIEIDRRVIPGENHMSVWQAVHDLLKARLDFEFTMHEPWTMSLPLSDELNQAFGEQFLATIKGIDDTKVEKGVPFCCHASTYGKTGVPSVVFGPGSIEQAHTKNEWLDLRELELAAKILFQFIRDYESA